MSPEEYLAQLKKELSNLTLEEQQEALEFYEEYLADAEDPIAAINSLGTPKEVARSIMADRVMKHMDTGKTKGVRSRISALWVVALATLSPLALSLTVLLFILFLTLLVAIFVFILGLAAANIYLLFVSILAFTVDFLSGLFFLGFAFIIIGITVLLATAVWRLGAIIIHKATLHLNASRLRRKNI